MRSFRRFLCRLFGHLDTRWWSLPACWVCEFCDTVLITDNKKPLITGVEFRFKRRSE